MKDQHSPDDLLRLTDELCNGTLDDAARAQLNETLRTDPAARESFAKYMFLHAELYAEHAGHAALPMTAAQSESACAPSRGRWWVGYLAIAASLLAVSLVSSWLTQRVLTDPGQEVAQQQPPVAAPPLPQQPVVAHVTATRNCRFADGAGGVGFGSALTAGQQLELVTGLAEITFGDGAKILLEGPARFEVHATNRAALASGRLAAVVPQRARGFSITTNGLNVIDLGTEFGLVAGEEGTSEVHVFNGLVKAHVLDRFGGEVEIVEVNSEEAVRIQPAALRVTRFDADYGGFVRSIAPAAGPGGGLYVYEPFDYPEGPLGQQNGGFGWAGPWEDIELAGAPQNAQAGVFTNGVAGGNLTHDALVPHGNRAVQTAQHNRIRRALSTSLGGVFDSAGLVENQDAVRLIGRDGTTVYLSFLQRTSATGDVFYGVELHRGDGNANRVLSIGNAANGNWYGATSNYNNYGIYDGQGLANFPSLGAEDTEVNFIVVKFEFGPENRDRVTVYRNPESVVDESQCRPDAVLEGNFAFDRISLANFEGTKVHEVDEIRLGTSYIVVTDQQSRDGEGRQRQLALRNDTPRAEPHALAPGGATAGATAGATTALRALTLPARHGGVDVGLASLPKGRNEFCRLTVLATLY